MNPTPSLQSEFPDRLIQLCDGRPGLRGGIHVEIRDPGPPPLTPVQSTSEIKNQNSKIQIPDGSCLDFISSDDTLDRYQEIITPTGWHLSNYQRNPVFQNSHQYGDIIFTLGKALITEVRQVGRAVPTAPSTLALYQRVQFATEANPLARIAYALYKGKFLNAVSVGFIPIRWENGVGQASGGSPQGPAGDGGVSPPFRRRYLEQELLEVSAVGIPANPNALALAYKSGAVQKSDLQETIDLLRQLAAGVSPSPRGEGRGEAEFRLANSDHTLVPPKSDEGGSRITHHAALLSLARQLRQLLAR